MKKLVLFNGGALLFAVAVLGVGYLIWGIDSVIQGSAALALTFLPAAATLSWVIFSYRTAPEMQMLASLGGSGVRMAIALGGGYLLTTSQPQTFAIPFWCWLILFYLVMLALEITVLVRQQPNVEGSLRNLDEKKGIS